MGISFTDADGFYTWYDPNEILCCGDAYAFTVSADGYVSLSQSVDIEPNIKKTLNFELQPLSVTPVITPTPVCEVKSVDVSPKRLTLKRGQSDKITVTLEGENGCLGGGKLVTVTIHKAGKRHISVTPTVQTTDENGEARFTVTAKNKTGNARIAFKADSLKKIIIVKIK